MSFTRTQFIAAVRTVMDAASSARWSDTDITAIGGLTFNNEWSVILNTNPYYRTNNVQNLTTDSNGEIAISSLTTGSGDTQKTFYRILSGFTDGTVLYREVDFRNVPLGTSTNYQSPWDYLYYLDGSNFQLLPVTASLSGLSVMVNWRPVQIDALAADSSTIDFPSGYEWLLAYQTGAVLLAKGGAETQATSDLMALAEEFRKSMLGYIGRLTTRPSSVQFQDLAMHWGS